MGQQASKRNDIFQNRKRRRGVIGTFTYLIVLIGLVSLLAWFLLGVGFGLYQLVQGEVQTQERINTILEANTAVLINNHHFLGSNANPRFELKKIKILEGILRNKYTLDMWQRARQKIQQGSELAQKKSPNLTYSIANIWCRVFRPLITTLLSVTVIVAERLFIFLLSLPLFLLFMCLGLVDGLVQRDIRKFQGARESTYLFHAIKRAWEACFFVPLFLYFVWPWPIDAMWFLMPMAIVLGLIMQISLQFFKKYI